MSSTVLCSGLGMMVLSSRDTSGGVAIAMPRPSARTPRTTDVMFSPSPEHLHLHHDSMGDRLSASGIIPIIIEQLSC
jgi:hypothetical protein